VIFGQGRNFFEIQEGQGMAKKRIFLNHSVLFLRMVFRVLLGIRAVIVGLFVLRKQNPVNELQQQKRPEKVQTLKAKDKIYTIGIQNFENKIIIKKIQSWFEKI